MKDLIEMVSDFAGFQYTPKFKSYTTPPTPCTSGATTPVRKLSEPAVAPYPERRHSVIITVGVNKSSKFPELQRQRIVE
ncbi:uncharacterized protein CELE_C08E8.3 [Caenorhabditis elegans]|uniref:Uncharacterized protein n=1 Tax=Caenorhabditis elegans TaxID=6239 RepID=O62042_CAEEL|nr:Uncharacterized protein CELE_C08E8.3 [Caenorhabditis elegans]CAB03859.2 Uncharacterized protein CELE_C08E8.3 [Caenorhabditis elegans]|eukprot:NP_507589.2 Uncharacterized protein CELE_C08E8.3 [Caenorhabditis elegans]